MKCELRGPRGRKIEVNETFIDKAIGYFDPIRGRKRFIARAQMAIAGGYIAGSKSRRETKEYTPLGNDPDTDILFDLETMRARSRDMIRNNPIASGAIKTKVNNVIGTGIKLQARIDRDLLGMDDAEADEWENRTERLWRLFWDNKRACDAAAEKTGDDLTRLVYNQALENGDAFVLFPRVIRPGNINALKIQIVEADRICNAGFAPDSEDLVAGIQRDKLGAPTEYHIMKGHPGARRYMPRDQFTWERIQALSPLTGLPNVLHIMNATRPGQARGVPDLAPVIEPLKQLGRYTEAELMAAVVAGLFTVFVKSNEGEGELDLEDLEPETGGKESDKDYKLAPGAIVGLAEGEDIETANPNRPNAVFDPFVSSILQQVGACLGIGYELVIKQFKTSYTAARASLLEAWKYFRSERKWISVHFCQEVYALWLYEMISSRYIYAPGYYTDPMIRQAYQGTAWIGPGKGLIKEGEEIKAAQDRIKALLSTWTDETAQLSGGDFDSNIRQINKEMTKIKDAGILAGLIQRSEGGTE